MNIQGKGTEANTFDAIVIGSGISGGWAAKELCEKGLKTLVLERGRDVKHGEYPTAMMDTFDFEGRGKVAKESQERQAKQGRTGYTTHPQCAHWFVDDIDHPYNETKRFDWMRGYHVGGRSLLWGRQSYRMGDLDFTANAKDGHGVDWPVRYKELSPWYDHVEEFVGLSGKAEGLAHLPDGKFLPAWDFNCVEEHAAEQVRKKFGDRIITMGRTTNLTVPHKGRGPCQARNRCIRGCPYAGYFSSNSGTLPAAYATGNLSLRPFSIASELIYDNEKGKAIGVRIIDAETSESIEYFANVIFCCASAVASTYILMNSKSDRFPEGFGNDSGELGHNLMDHHFIVGANGVIDGFEDKYYSGRRPTGFYIPRFRNVNKETMRSDFVRGYGYQGSASRLNWSRGIAEFDRLGADLKADLLEPGPWRMGMGAWGEHLPYHDNKMTLDYENADKWGLPTVTFDCDYKENELAMRKDAQESAKEILDAAGFKNITGFDHLSAPGQCIHEMGTARMGRDPKTSVLNGFNQVHASPNVFVTDGAFMTSSACQNPSLTYMAFTARAADHAVNELKKGNL
ncbi:GMC family oxidoreductase [Pelagicoccus sp. SDUM812002]|uniref:GMC family oxidoreductase n=1 Tax=Pelagicoccus sp. SDUM812002 TaxID=3041266 RepID=UPI00280C5747|nr:GMC family oxidoreductase [Pelagicoccus sp. SDUM812002]MDQ8184683.1 GMC family oxidoreductase [Pelagicoccus sp. SDUM812002]